MMLRCVPLALLTAVWAGSTLAQDEGEAALDALHRTEALVCVIEDEMMMIVLQRDADGTLYGIGPWSEWQISEGSDQLALLHSGDVIQITGETGFIIRRGVTKQGQCLSATEPLQQAFTIAANGNLEDALARAQAERSREMEELRAQLADALAQIVRAQQQASDAMKEAERQAALLAAAQAELVEREGLSGGQHQVAALNAQVAELRAQVASLQELLDAAEASDEAAQVEIQSLGEELNTALARVAQEQRQRAEAQAERAEAETLRAEAETARAEEEARRAAAEEELRIAAEAEAARLAAGAEGQPPATDP